MKISVKHIPGVGTARIASGAATAVRAAFSDATNVVGRRIVNLPRGLRAVTTQRAVPATFMASPSSK